ncbi:hypothetical protein IP81_17060 [Novosphingobium sp. AAP83]|uniref:hypothetical protein n=1 Tax=Novosphingobium sp. AAP83 TaxID=1523425 RepID=UPI0006B9E393|nr:hypothetical protein [Novosphingobium sp. AAP83]KPF89128.1 hypothetical protein IP81_17060 [Novosphingobium sp. AAP83]
MLVEGLDPRVERAKLLTKVEEKPVVTFGVFAMELVDDIQEGFKNPKHRQQWRSALKVSEQER